MPAIPALLRTFVPVAVAAFALSGCNDSLHQSTLAAQSHDAQVLSSGYSPRPAAVAVTQMEGAPAPLKSQFMAYFNADAAREDVALTDTAGARYLARGYISAFLVDGGAKLTYVWDIYDRTNRRAHRLNDEIALKGAAADPWSLVDSSALAALAAQSANELAAYLSTTPEALAAAAQNASDAARAAVAPAAPAPDPAASQALSYAETH
ncbi:MAG TPA: hypothetical protein VMU18_07540 [Rhodoblastus sp.]|nr:hypothetical protein [Rhodoblastus sp.]